MWWRKALSWVIGEVSPLDYILGALLIGALGWSASLKWEASDLKSDLSKCKDENGLLITDKKLYEQAIAQGKESQKEKIVYVDREIGKVEVQTKEIIKTVKEYVYDQNKTKCENGMARIRRTGF